MTRFDRIHGREIIGWQARETEPAPAGAHNDLVLFLSDLDRIIIWQVAHNIHQFARWHRESTWLSALQFDRRSQFNFEVGCGQQQLIVLTLDQDIGEYRQGLPSFNHTDDRLEWPKQGIPIHFKLHDDFRWSLYL